MLIFQRNFSGAPDTKKNLVSAVAASLWFEVCFDIFIYCITAALIFTLKLSLE